MKTRRICLKNLKNYLVNSELPPAGLPNNVAALTGFEEENILMLTQYLAKNQTHLSEEKKKKKIYITPVYFFPQTLISQVLDP